MQKFIITILSLYYCICINATSFTVSNVDNEEVPKDHVPIVVKKKSLNSNLHRSSTLYIEAMADTITEIAITHIFQAAIQGIRADYEFYRSEVRKALESEDFVSVRALKTNAFRSIIKASKL